MLFGAVISLVLCICLYDLYTRCRAHHLPPGISGLRCLFEIPKGKIWSKVLQLNRKYGDITSISLCGYNIILIGSAKIADDLLEKRGMNYVDRPRSVMGELSGWGTMMLLCNYTDRFRTQRRWIAQDIGSHANVAKVHRMIEVETRRSFRLVLEDPDRIRVHLRRNVTSIALHLSHGYITNMEGDDPLVELTELANSQLSKTLVAGAHAVDFIPFLKYIPSWVPGAGFKKRAAEYAAVLRDILEIPHDYVQSQLAAGTALPSLSSRLLSLPDLTEEQRDNIKWTASSVFRGTHNTSTSASYAFYLAMTLYPRVMKKAQQELDSVVGTGRLPTFTDRPSLPYMEALFTELFRWHTPGPISLRRTRANDEYNGYLIPEGSYVVVNIWAMLRDERTYTDPLEFKPERFLGDNPEPHPFNVCFGFYFAQSTIWLLCAQSLAAFDISKRVENGVEVTPEFNYEGEALMYVAPFKCLIKPRSETAADLVKEEFPM
ncbi:cytochrome P450 [Butyriboletus roseoflavus]|nr:cytochrome P450 [Butyriboletus roseoflavus]